LKAVQASDYLRNIDVQNKAVQDSNFRACGVYSAARIKTGVEVQKAK
jgi:hypothetical protein